MVLANSGVVVIGVGGAAGSGGDDPADTKTAQTEQTEEATEATEATEALTTGQRNALGSAESYLPLCRSHIQG